MNKSKEQAQADYIAMIRNSWTFQRMTQEEQEKAINALHCPDMLQGSYRQRWYTLEAVYRAFLLGIGYDGADWREPEENKPLPFIVGEV